MCTNYKNENTIENFLIQNNITYEPQKRFSDCRDIKPLPFDFYLPYLGIAIEYDGEGHYKAIPRGKGDSKEELRKVQKHDNIKTEYCKENGIKLIRIPYWESEA